MKKQKNRTARTYIFPWVMLFVIGFVFIAASDSAGVSIIFSQIATICRYFSCFYGIILLAEMRYHALTHRAPDEQQEKRGKDKKMSAFFRNLAKKLHLGKKDAAAPDDATAATPPAPADEEARREKTTRKRILALSVVYLICQAFLVSRFISYQIYDSRVSLLALDNDYNFFHIGLTAAVAILFFSVGVWMRGKEQKPGSETARGFIVSVGVVCALSSLFITLYTMLDIPCLRALLWILRIYSLCVVLLMVIGVVIALIKRELLTNFNYLLPADFFKNRKKRSVADFLEEHTGLSVKSLWSIRYAASILPATLLGLIAVLFAATCVYKVEPYQQAVIYRFGRITSPAAVEQGIHLKLPWPIDQAAIYDVNRVREISIGYEDQTSNDNLWTQAHAGEEYKLLLGDGNELVSVNMKLAYVIDDLYSYVTAFSAPEDVLGAKAYELVMSKTINTDLDTLLSVDRSGFADDMQKELNVFCKEAGFGLHVNEVFLESIHPPIDVADVYQGVVSAAVQKNTLITNAQATALEEIAAAEQESNTAILAAQADQTTRVADAQYQMRVFLAAAEAYRTHPDAVTLAKYLDTFQTVVTGKKVYVFIGNHDLSDFVVNLSDNTTVITKSAFSQQPAD